MSISEILFYLCLLFIICLPLCILGGCAEWLWLRFTEDRE